MIKKSWLLILLISFCGCAVSKPGENPLRVTSGDYDAAWQATMTVLEERFGIKEAEKDAGTIVTEWKRSEPFLDWTPRPAGEAFVETLNIVRRRATAKITRENGTISIALNILRERISVGAPRTSASEGYSLYNPAVSELSPEGEEGVVSISLGRDQRLEGKILAEIRQAQP
ncbi:MAG: hypothetical protein AMS15_05060 [Planctomycetes bacterium DG_23]|nr:MAG: hypothetical protein AMS15_05060 [Planctomycetes bacterium DG_23]